MNRHLRPLTGALLFAAAPLHAQHGVDVALARPDFTTWTLLGSASASNMTPGNGFTYGQLQLTQAGLGDQAGAAFAPEALTLDFDQAFRFSFNFFIPVSTELRGDGLTLTLAAAPALGGGGSGLGYEGMGPSVAFAIDTFHFDGEPVSPSLQILAGGSTTPLAYTETGLGDAIRDPNFQWAASLVYTPSGLGNQSGTLTGTLEHLNLGSFSVAATVDFSAVGLTNGPVFWGFTAGNGLATDGHLVGWGAPLPVPEPSSALMWLGGALMLAGMRRLRQQAAADVSA